MRGTTWRRHSALALAAVALIVGERRGSTGVIVTTAEVSAGSIQRPVAVMGTLEAVRSVDVGTQVSGTVASLNANVDSVVSAGQVLARLDSASVEAQVREAEAERSAADAALSGVETAADAARENLSRTTRLATLQMIPRAELDAAEMAVDEANVDVAAAESSAARARAALAEAAAMRDRTIIRAPIDGIVVERHVDVGQTVAEPGQAPVMFRLAADLKQMHMQIALDGSNVGGVHAGDPVIVEVAAYPGETFRGTVLQVLQPTPSTGATSVVEAVAAVTNADDKLRPGMRATAKLNGSRRDQVVRIPNMALSFRPPADVLQAIPRAEAPLTDDEGHADAGRLTHVWKYDGRQFIDTAIHVGLGDDEWTELTGGAVQVGDQLVTAANLERRRPD